ncbi:hypothetical protein [Sphingomicrobium clamense]|uniref:Uncharacterized protein n=1 Tax=Sphingomicrobium clamense TaxID=2851013 RepID=A0ABS6V437_9SPHN|nr:hypothetical protein [Sphingomicrobium sp. B8]MBW0144309.1 hypothetical protein [Sphingomicrobium sp. B8]
MKTILMAAASIAAMTTATPALAQDDPDVIVEEMEEGLDTLLNDPDMPDRMATMAVALLSVVEAMPIGQMEAAIEGRAPTAEEAERRLGDEIQVDRDMLAHQTRAAMVQNREQMQGAVRAMALMLPVLIATADNMAEAIEDAGIDDR